MKPRAIDVSHLPEYAFSHRNLMWWGGAWLMAIEGMMFALLFMSYLYLKGRSPDWPPGYFAPGLVWGTLNTAVLVMSAVPNHLAKKAAERMDLRALRLWLAVAIGFGLGFSVIRIVEFRALNVWWDSNAYGSLVWLLLGFHTTHVITDVVDSVALEGAALHRSDGEVPLRGRGRELVVLALRGRHLDSGVCLHLHRAPSRMSPGALSRCGPAC